ncbi:MAG: thioredoxin domain-containing protein [Deltaproteobacteria bacterium]|nr:thioredoxin domain-containing protein [Deltaproteobacteria bacterium]
MRYKQTVTGCALLLTSLFTGQALAAANTTTPSKIDWNVEKTWNLPAKPLDIVYSLDGKRVFILTDQHTVLVYDNLGVLTGSIPVDKGVSAIDIAPRGERLFLINQETKAFSDLTIDFIADINTVDSPFLGVAKAPVTIVLFTDFECPYCSKVAPLLEQVLAKNPDTVKIVLKNLPLGMHQFADPAARAALAAGEQGKFWEFHNALFALPALNIALNEKAIDDIAVKLGLKMDQFKSDMASPKIRQKVDQDIMDAQKAGVTGTPTIFVNGHPLRERTLEDFQKKIDAALGKSEKK